VAFMNPLFHPSGTTRSLPSFPTRRSSDLGFSSSRRMGIYARRAQHVPTRVLARWAAVDRLAEQHRRRTDHDPGGNPERHRGNESFERGGDQDVAGGGRAGESEAYADEGEAEH